jgi:hypothetical protein
MKNKTNDKVSKSSFKRMRWILVLLSPLWAYLLVEILRIFNILNINEYNGWKFGEIPCNVEVLRHVDAVYVEYWHFPTLDAWITFTLSFLILGVGITLRMNRAKGTQLTKRSLLLVLIVVLSTGIFGLNSLIAPKGEQIPFFILSFMSAILVFIAFSVQGYLSGFSWYTLVHLTTPIFVGYSLGLLISLLLYATLYNLELLPAIAYCFD